MTACSLRCRQTIKSRRGGRWADELCFSNHVVPYSLAMDREVWFKHVSMPLVAFRLWGTAAPEELPICCAWVCTIVSFHGFL